jgi:hypothetical protein
VLGGSLVKFDDNGGSYKVVLTEASKKNVKNRSLFKKKLQKKGVRRKKFEILGKVRSHSF